MHGDTFRSDWIQDSARSFFNMFAQERVTDNEEMTAVGFEPTQLALVELESTPLDHSGKLS